MIHSAGTAAAEGGIAECLSLTGGGITADGQHWELARGEFLVPVAVLSRKIAARFRAALEATAPAVFAEISAETSGNGSESHSASTTAMATMPC
jgi:hypothetical protein